MPYDQDFAQRMRDSLQTLAPLEEKKMFGGICFLDRGNLCCGFGKHGLMVRIRQDMYSQALEEAHVRPFDITGKVLKDMISVDPEALASRAELEKWLKEALNYTQELPAKMTKKKSTSKKAPAKKAKKAAKIVPAEFSGYFPQSFEFLSKLTDNNQKAWFDEHRGEYDQYYLKPSLDLINTLGPKLQQLSPTLQFEPRVNGSLFRIQRDVRFSKDKTPYKNHIDMGYWEGEKKAWNTSMMFMRITDNELILGAGIHKFSKEALEVYRRQVDGERTGKELITPLNKLAKANYLIGGQSRKTVPRGYDREHPRADLLKHEGIFGELRCALPEVITTPEFVDWCFKQYQGLMPLHQWLKDTLQA